MSTVGNFSLWLNSGWLGQRLTWLSRWLCHEANDGNCLSTAMEGPLAVNGVIENKNSAAVAARRNTKDGGMTAFQAADTQTVAVQELVDRIG